jgi:hypothetical protein
MSNTFKDKLFGYHRALVRLGQGLRDELLAELSQCPHLKVAADQRKPTVPQANTTFYNFDSSILVKYHSQKNLIVKYDFSLVAEPYRYSLDQARCAGDIDTADMNTLLQVTIPAGPTISSNISTADFLEKLEKTWQKMKTKPDKQL